MKTTSANKKDDWVTFIPETQLDWFYLGRISKKVRCYIEIRSNTDDPEKKLHAFKMKIEDIINLLQI